MIEGASSDGDLVPLLTAERGSAPTSVNLLAVDVEKNPLSSEADYGLSWLMEPVEIVYVEVNAQNQFVVALYWSRITEHWCRRVIKSKSRLGESKVLPIPGTISS